MEDNDYSVTSIICVFICVDDKSTTLLVLAGSRRPGGDMIEDVNPARSSDWIMLKLQARNE